MRILRKEIKEVRFLIISILLLIFYIIGSFFGILNIETGVLLLHSFLIFFALAFLYEKNIKETFIKLKINYNWEKTAKYVFFGFFGIIVYLLFLGIVLNFFGISDQYKTIEKIEMFTPLVIFAAVFIGPVSEELFFRGFLTQKFGILPSSIIFSLAHFAYGSYTQIIGTFGMGLILAYIYKDSKSILPCILIHFLYNLSAILAFWWLY
ncbi:MAG: type II CAAX endopeptidase family protein [Candidatus Micrarchaeia archaeon]